MTKHLEVPWLVGDDCWILVGVPTYSKPVPCPECKGRGEYGKTKAGNIRQCPDCRGHKTITTCETTWYTQWSRVTSVAYERFWHGGENNRVGVTALFTNDETGKPYVGCGDATNLDPSEVFETEAEAIKYAKAKKRKWHPAIQGKRPAKENRK